MTVVLVLTVGYALLSHYSNTVPDAKGLGAGLSVGPILLIAALLVWRWSHPLLAASIFLLAGALLYHCWPVLKQYYEWADVAQQCAAYGLVSCVFAHSLWGGRVPVCTQMTEKLHGPLTPREIAYTRGATVAWTVFYGLLAAVIGILFLVTSLRVWSLFVNFATFGLIGIVFLADHAIRQRVLPRRPGGILAAIRQSLSG
jgi:uncharacterized membrane protein